MLLESPFFRVNVLAQRLKVSYPTAQADIRKLAEAGIVEELPGIYPKTFGSREVHDIACRED